MELDVNINPGQIMKMWRPNLGEFITSIRGTYGNKSLIIINLKKKCPEGMVLDEDWCRKCMRVSEPESSAGILNAIEDERDGIDDMATQGLVMALTPVTKMGEDGKLKVVKKPAPWAVQTALRIKSERENKQLKSKEDVTDTFNEFKDKMLDLAKDLAKKKEPIDVKGTVIAGDLV